MGEKRRIIQTNYPQKFSKPLIKEGGKNGIDLVTLFTRKGTQLGCHGQYFFIFLVNNSWAGPELYSRSVASH